MHNWYHTFYWVTRGDSVKSFFDVTSNIFTTFAIILFIGVIVCSIGVSYNVADNNSKNDEEDKVDSDIRSWQRMRKYCTYLFYPFLKLGIEQGNISMACKGIRKTAGGFKWKLKN